jgi:hypothetical protein
MKTCIAAVSYHSQSLNYSLIYYSGQIIGDGTLNVSLWQLLTAVRTRESCLALEIHTFPFRCESQDEYRDVPARRQEHAVPFHISSFPVVSIRARTINLRRLPSGS